MRNVFVLLAVFFLIFGCNKNDNDSEKRRKISANHRQEIMIKDDSIVSVNYASDEDITLWKNRVRLNGDTIAYGNLQIALLDYSEDTLFYWTQLMAEKYEYPPACYNMYGFYGNDNNFEMDEETKKYFAYYLRKAIEGGYNPEESLKALKYLGYPSMSDAPLIRPTVVPVLPDLPLVNPKYK